MISACQCSVQQNADDPGGRSTAAREFKSRRPHHDSTNPIAQIQSQKPHRISPDAKAKPTILIQTLPTVEELESVRRGNRDSRMEYEGGWKNTPASWKAVNPCAVCLVLEAFHQRRRAWVGNPGNMRNMRVSHEIQRL